MKQLFVSIVVVGLGLTIAGAAAAPHDKMTEYDGIEASLRTVALEDDMIDTPHSRYNEDIIVFSAHQDWLSRIYLLQMDGSVITYFEYDFYYFADLEVVNNEVYVAEAFAPRVYKIDLRTGDLELIIDDWSLYYFYDLGFDGTYFYVTEWDLNRYDINGNFDGRASFDEDVMGSAWDGRYLWMLNDVNQIKCWNVSRWPSLTEVPGNMFAPPTAQCRGLWFDGHYFWTAESIDGVLGKIYQFDYDGTVVDQWLAPAFRGWSACVVKGTTTPDPDQSYVTLTDESYTGLTTCPAGDGPSYQFVQITVKNVNGYPLAGIPASSFAFTVSPIGATQWYGICSCTFTAVDPETNTNGEIRFAIAGDTAIFGNITIAVTVDGVSLNDLDVLPCNSFDLNIDGSVNLIDFGMFAGDYLGTAHRSDYNWDGIVNLIDFGMFASH